MGKRLYWFLLVLNIVFTVTISVAGTHGLRITNTSGNTAHFLTPDEVTDVHHRTVTEQPRRDGEAAITRNDNHHHPAPAPRILPDIAFGETVSYILAPIPTNSLLGVYGADHNVSGGLLQLLLYPKHSFW